MRELGVPARPAFPSGDYLIRPRRAAGAVGFARLQKDAEHVLARICEGEGPS